MTPIGVLGAGSWGTALAAHLGAAGRPVLLWARRLELAQELERSRSSSYLPGVSLPAAVRFTHTLGDLRACPMVVLVVPSHALRTVLHEFLSAAAPGGAPVTLVSAIKGVEGDTLARMSEVCAAEAASAGVPVDFAVLSGPTFAAEVAAGVPSAAVVAAADSVLAKCVQETLATAALRLYHSTDVVGVELAGAAKNVIAIAAGVTSGLGLGHNTLAALITRGLHEITRLGVAYGADPRTFSGLAGLGDLVLTCTGGLSRNRRTGLDLAAGRSLAEIQGGSSMIAEGVRNSLAIAQLAERKGVEMPITEQMVAVLHRGKPPREALADLMRRELKEERAL